MRRRFSNRTTRGFTLLEISVTMGILLILAGGIFSVTTSSLQLTAELSDFQKRNLLKKRFIELCRMNLEDLPGHADVKFRIDDRGQYYATYLSLVDHPFAFSFGGDAVNVHRVILEADVVGNYLRASVLYLNEEESDLYEQESLDPSAVQRRIVLLRRLRQLSWRFYDNNRQEWIDPHLWTQPRNPGLVELMIAMEDDAVPERAVFWIPPQKAVSTGSGRNNDREEDEEDEENEEDDTDDGGDENEVSNPVTPAPVSRNR